jgi:hypothetical protein
MDRIRTDDAIERARRMVKRAQDVALDETAVGKMSQLGSSDCFHLIGEINRNQLRTVTDPTGKVSRARPKLQYTRIGIDSSALDHPFK